MKTLTDKTMYGTIEMKNRFIRAAVGDLTCEGHLTDDNYKLYESLAKGDVALITSGYTVVDKRENITNIFSMAEDRFIPEYRRLTDIVHDNGGKIICQLVYTSGFAPIERPLAPSDFKNPYTQIQAYEMTKEEISEMTALFANAARRVREAGFDGVEIHGAHGFLQSQFFSPAFNHRADEYGGSLENRARFMFETYDAIRKAVGDDFTIAAKINTDDGIPGGVTPEDYLYLAKNLSDRGIDGIEVSGMWAAHKPKDRMYYREAATKIAEAVSCKVIQTGGNREFEAMSEVLNGTKVEYFGFARPFISQPDWTKLYTEGNLQKMRCTSCNWCLTQSPTKCIFNANKEEKAQAKANGSVAHHG